MSRRALQGFTLVETSVTLALVGGLFLSLSAIARISGGFYDVTSTNMDIEARGNRLIHRVAESLRATELDSIAGLPQAPLSGNALLFQTVGPYDDKSTTTTDPIQITVRNGSVVRTDSYLLPGELSQSLTDGVPDLFEGEAFNGLDDNANGYVDEPGLFFARQDDSIVIGLTLSSEDETRSWITRVTCRN